MTDLSRIKPSHTARASCIYVRQSSPSQVEHNRESTARQYALADRACQLGWIRSSLSMTISVSPVRAPKSAPVSHA